jgi:hypothetical protein
VHDEDLAGVICRCVEGGIVAPPAPMTVAHDRPWTFREILAEIARANSKSVSFVPVPWRLVWAVLRTAELSGMRMQFRSDSVISLMYQNPDPAFASSRETGVVCRPFDARTARF